MRATDSYAKTRWKQVTNTSRRRKPTADSRKGWGQLVPNSFQVWIHSKRGRAVPILESAMKKTGTVLQTFIRLLTPGLKASSKRIAQGMQAKQVLHSTAERPQPHSVERGVQKASDLAAIT